MSQYETKVVFNGVVSFKDREAAATFLALVGSVVDDSVQVFHAKTEPDKLSAELGNIKTLLHHFEDSVDTSDKDDDLHLTQQTASHAADSIDRIRSTLRLPYSDDTRMDLATQFKLLFENLVVLMQLSERQQSKHFVKNINVTLETLDNACATTRRTSYLHNQNLKSALEVIVRGAGNRAEVAQDHILQEDLRAVKTELQTEGQFFTNWMDAVQHDESVSETEKRVKAERLRHALLRLKSAVDIKIASSAEFAYKFLDRQRFNRAVDTLAYAAKSKDKAAVVEAAKEITEIVKDTENRDLDEAEADRLRAEAKKLLQDASANLKGEEKPIDTGAAKESMAKLADEEKQIKGKPLVGTLPNAIQSMAALLKSREAKQAQPSKKFDGPEAQQGGRPEVAPPPKEEEPDAQAPGYGLVAVMANKK